jgi:hypothetical protein
MFSPNFVTNRPDRGCLIRPYPTAPASYRVVGEYGRLRPVGHPHAPADEPDVLLHHAGPLLVSVEQR